MEDNDRRTLRQMAEDGARRMRLAAESKANAVRRKKEMLYFYFVLINLVASAGGSFFLLFFAMDGFWLHWNLFWTGANAVELRNIINQGRKTP